MTDFTVVRKDILDELTVLEDEWESFKLQWAELQVKPSETRSCLDVLNRTIRQQYQRLSIVKSIPTWIGWLRIAVRKQLDYWGTPQTTPLMLFQALEAHQAYPTSSVAQNGAYCFTEAELKALTLLNSILNGLLVIELQLGPLQGIIEADINDLHFRPSTGKARLINNSSTGDTVRYNNYDHPCKRRKTETSYKTNRDEDLETPVLGRCRRFAFSNNTSDARAGLRQMQHS